MPPNPGGPAPVVADIAEVVPMVSGAVVTNGVAQRLQRMAGETIATSTKRRTVGVAASA